MRIGKIDYDNYTVAIENWGYPKRVVIYDADERDVLVPMFIRKTDLRPKSGSKLEITVVDNGYIFKSGRSTKIMRHDDYNFDEFVNEFLKHEVETEEKLEDVLDDSDLEQLRNEVSFKFNTKYKGGQVSEEDAA